MNKDTEFEVDFVEVEVEHGWYRICMREEERKFWLKWHFAILIYEVLYLVMVKKFVYHIIFTPHIDIKEIQQLNWWKFIMWWIHNDFLMFPNKISYMNSIIIFFTIFLYETKSVCVGFGFAVSFQDLVWCLGV